MTNPLLAANTKTGNWPGRIGLGVAGFLLLWAFVAAAARATRHTPKQSAV